MTDQTKKSIFFRPLDLLVYAVVLFLALALLCLPLFGGDGGRLAVTVAGETTYYSLGTDRILTLSGNGHTMRVAILDGEVFVEETDCPEEICRRTGKISRTGESILCARADIYLRILDKGPANGTEGGYDGIAG
ncbi:MAG: NusG domain II-containing protein [Clostridia bacterium]|nr:NusG domain II-containing protein [Clostridia bacterium]